MRRLAEGWETEEFYPRADEFFAALRTDFDRAQKSIDLSFYIFELDTIGGALLEQLKVVSRRGVRVRLLVDGVGTDQWSYDLEDAISESSVQLAVHNPVPWPFSRWVLRRLQRPRDFFRFWRRVNRRNHRKLVVIDEEIAFVGGINISENENDWEDFAARVTGPAVRKLVDVFQGDWTAAYHPQKNFIRSALRESLQRWKERDAFMHHILYSNRLWMTTGYFIPPLKLLAKLKRKALAGSDVRLLVSKKSDFQALTWLSRFYLRSLVRSGVQVYLYPHRFIHAKCILLDREALVGSSNMNYRSYLLDHELDLTLRQKETLQEVQAVFAHLMRQSYQMDRTSFEGFPLYQSWVARFLSFFKGWM